MRVIDVDAHVHEPVDATTRTSRAAPAPSPSASGNSRDMTLELERSSTVVSAPESACEGSLGDAIPALTTICRHATGGAPNAVGRTDAIDSEGQMAKPSETRGSSALCSG